MKKDTVDIAIKNYHNKVELSYVREVGETKQDRKAKIEFTKKLQNTFNR